MPIYRANFYRGGFNNHVQGTVEATHQVGRGGFGQRTAPHQVAGRKLEAGNGVQPYGGRQETSTLSFDGGGGRDGLRRRKVHQGGKRD